MTPPPSREPGQAEVPDALTRPLAAGEAEQIQDHAEHHTAFWQDTLRLLRDRTRYQEVLRLWDDHLPGCSGSPRCECGYAEARALLEEVPDAK